MNTLEKITSTIIETISNEGVPDTDVHVNSAPTVDSIVIDLYPNISIILVIDDDTYTKLKMAFHHNDCLYDFRIMTFFCQLPVQLHALCKSIQNLIRTHKIDEWVKYTVKELLRVSRSTVDLCRPVPQEVKNGVDYFEGIYQLFGEMDNLRSEPQYAHIAKLIDFTRISVDEDSSIYFVSCAGVVFLVKDYKIYTPTNFILCDLSRHFKNSLSITHQIQQILEGYSDEEKSKFTDDDWATLTGIVSI